MSSIAQEIRNYVKEHNNEVTFLEVKDYVLNQKHMQTTEKSIRKTLFRILKQTGGILKKQGISQEIRDYVKRHNYEVSYLEVKDYILNQKHIQTNDSAIRGALNRYLKETNGILKRTGLSQEIRDYVEKHNYEVTYLEVRNYILNQKHMQNTDSAIRSALDKILKESGGVLKRTGVSQEIRDYVKVHNNEVTFLEVKDYILNQKNMQATESSIRCALSRILQETGTTLKRTSVLQEIRNYVKLHNNKVSFLEVKDYILNQKNMQVTESSIRCALSRILKETGGTLKRSKRKK